MAQFFPETSSFGTLLRRVFVETVVVDICANGEDDKQQ
jgi:hypothetical protein